MDWRPAALMCVCIARQVSDGEFLAQGLSTPPVAGSLLASRRHAPHADFAGGSRRREAIEAILRAEGA